MKNLNKRIITGIVIISIIIFMIFILSNIFSQMLLVIIFIIALYEWAKIVKIKTLKNQMIYINISLILMFLSLYMPFIYLYISIIFWIISCILIMMYPNIPDYIFSSISLKIIGILMIIPMWISIQLLNNNKELLFFIITIITVADTNAYFFGKKYGTRPLAFHISKNKTIEGLLAAMISTTLVSMIFSLIRNYNIILFIVISFFIVMIALLGDLFESIIKRKLAIKDSGTILPGHGGILDRMDSYFSTLPIIFVFLYLIGLISIY